MWGSRDPMISGVAAGAFGAGLGLWSWLGDSRRRSSGVVAPPASLPLVKIGLIAVVAVVVVSICNTNRASIGTLEGVPWVVPIVLGVLIGWTILLQRTKYGRYVY